MKEIELKLKGEINRLTNKTFKFVRFAREAISRVKEIEANNIIEVCH